MKPIFEFRYWQWTLLMILLLAAAQACQMLPQSENNEGQVETMVAETLAAIAANQSQTQQAEETEAAALIEEATPEPETEEEQAATPSPTITSTATLSVPVVSVSQNTNCRTGPGQIYSNIGAFLVGQTSEVIARNSDSSYWIIPNPSGSGHCWLWGFYATVDGPTANLPVWDPPATPTPVVTVYRSGNLEIQDTFGADLDQGAIGFWATTDFIFQMDGPEPKLNATNGANFYVWGGAAPTRNDCSTGIFQVINPINLAFMAFGDYLCYYTTGGRWGRLQINDLTNGPNWVLKISYTTWNNP